MNIGDRGEEIFLGREIMERRDVSEQTAQLVDAEVRKLLDGAYEDASRVMKKNQDKLHVLANALLDRETLDSDEIRAVFDGKELPPLPEEEGAKEDGRQDASRDAVGSNDAAGHGAPEKLEPATSLKSARGETTKPEP